MPGGKVHFEIFVRKMGPGGGWQLVDALSQRDKAIKKAQVLHDAGGLKGVKVVKETYTAETGDYLSLTVFELGDTAEAAPRKTDDEATLPCFRPQDLYSAHSRATIARLLADYLGRNRLTVSELIHRADALESLTATGTILQHAVQKIAVAHAGATGQSVQDAVRKLNDLVSKACERVYKDARADAFPKLAEGGLCAAFEEVAMREDPDYLLCSSVAHHLKDYQNWADKLGATLALMETKPADEPGRDICLGILDRFVCDMVAGRAAVQDLMGEQTSLGALLTQMTDLFLGQIDPEDPEVRPGIRGLAQEFVRGKLGGARAAIGHRILAELKAPRRLEPDCLETEVAVVRKLAGKMVLGQGKYLPIEDITDAFATRSRRLLASDAIEPFLEALKSPAERIDRLIALEGNIVGIENKRTLVTILLPQITAHATERFYVDQKNNPLVRLREVSGYQARILASDFPDIGKRQLAEALDTLACEIEAKASMIEGLCKRSIPIEDKVVALLRMVTGGILTQGELTRRAKVTVIRLMRLPAFASVLARGAQGDPKTTSRFKEMCQLIEQADLHGISAAA